ncbi:FG-GAP repeat protein [Terricaulis sp.]|uniref:FG-GAP repeat protein n=1 Tax=Terricaulis sp. TaxID=2768686 RepID=UPI0037839AD7
MRGAVLIVTVVLAACAPPSQRVDVANVPQCSALARGDDGRVSGDCLMTAGPAQLHVTFEEPGGTGQGGAVRVDVLNDQGAVAQTFTEANVSELLLPSADDIDGDGRADILIGIASGNVNTEYAVWLYNGADNAYRRAGIISGMEFSRTSEGYLAAPARSSAASWNVAFYRVEATLEPLVTISVTATDVTDAGQVRASECKIEAAPGLASLNMTEEAARAKFCAEPQAGVFQ